MLEAEFDQAAGLSALQLLPPTRVLPVVQSPAQEESLELLYLLEQAFQALGLPVWVRQGWRGSRAQPAATDAHGLLQRELADTAPGTVVLWQAPLEAWAVLLAGSAAQPLVALSAKPASLLYAYNAVKVLWQVSSLLALVLSLPETGPRRPGLEDKSALQALKRLGQDRLGVQPQVWPLGYDCRVNLPRTAVGESCALKVLETALVLKSSERRSHVYPIPTERCAFAADQICGVLDVHRQWYA